MNRPIAIIICLTAAIILAIALVFPKKDDLDSLIKKVNEKKAELQSKEDYFASLRQTDEDFKKYQGSLAKIGSALPPSSQLPALFDFLQKASSQTGMVLTNINPLTGKPSGMEGISEHSINIVVSGTYSAFRNFLSVLERSSRLIEVGTASFSIQEKTPEFNLRIKAYSY